MKNAKRLAALFLTAAVLLTAGCSRKTVTSQSSVWFIAKSTNTEFWKSAFAGANAAKSEYNVDLTICGPETEEDYEEQNRLIDEAVAAGADAISLTNTFQACAIDLEKRRPVFNNIFAGLSGPAVRPIALRMVWQAVGAVNIPVVGLGGIATGRDALEFIMAGAAAVQVGAANFANPRAMETIADEMAAWMDKNGVKTLDEIRGCARNAE